MKSISKKVRYENCDISKKKKCNWGKLKYDYNIKNMTKI